MRLRAPRVTMWNGGIPFPAATLRLGDALTQTAGSLPKALRYISCIRAPGGDLVRDVERGVERRDARECLQSGAGRGEKRAVGGYADTRNAPAEWPSRRIRPPSMRYCCARCARYAIPAATSCSAAGYTPFVGPEPGIPDEPVVQAREAPPAPGEQVDLARELVRLVPDLEGTAVDVRDDGDRRTTRRAHREVEVEGLEVGRHAGRRRVAQVAVRLHPGDRAARRWWRIRRSAGRGDQRERHGARKEDAQQSGHRSGVRQSLVDPADDRRRGSRAGVAGSVFVSPTLLVTTCTEQSGTASSSTHSGRFCERLGRTLGLDGPAHRLVQAVRVAHRHRRAVPHRAGHRRRPAGVLVTVVPDVQERHGQTPGAHQLVGLVVDVGEIRMHPLGDRTRCGPRRCPSVQIPAAWPAAMPSRFTMLASATTPAGGMPCCCMDHAMPNVPTEPALPPWRNASSSGTWPRRTGSPPSSRGCRWSGGPCRRAWCSGCSDPAC